MVTDIVKMAASGEMRKNSLIQAHPILKYFRSKNARTIENYLRLDDTSIVSLIRLIADHKLGPISLLAERYFKRDSYKCIELPTSSSGEILKSASANFIAALSENKIKFFDDRLPAKSYKQYDVMDENYLKNILVKKDGEYEPLGKISEIVKNIPPRTIRLYFRSRGDRDLAVDLLAQCMSGPMKPPKIKVEKQAKAPRRKRKITAKHS